MALNRIQNTANYIKDNCNSLKFKGKIISYDSFNLYDKIPGVWSLWSACSCLTCGQTVDLKKELQWCLRTLANQNLKNLEAENPGYTGRWYLIQEYKNLEFKLICINEKDRSKREIIEAIEAINNNALYWLPSITQQYNDFKEKLIDYINS